MLGFFKSFFNKNPFRSRVKSRGKLTIKLFDKNGDLKLVKVHNTVTTQGTYGIADNILASPSLGKPTHMAIGNSTPGADALGNEVDRQVLTSKTRNNAVVTFVAEWAAGEGTGAITEAGIFNDASSGHMWCSSVFSEINKGAADTLQISWALTIGT